MHIPSKIWSCLSYLVNIVTFSTFEHDGHQQLLVGNVVSLSGADLVTTKDYLHFPPPGGARKPDWDAKNFECKYDMEGWTGCSTPENRGCWLRHENGTEFNITTDYENLMPKGVDRYYWFDIAKGVVNADGLNFTDAKLINGSYPGPWLQACWGDRIIVNVTNRLEFNGTALHWHGIRQHKSTHMDGVPGITQCPIAPGDSFVYEFTAKQYGSAWYHSHYSVQYADGMLGPMTIHGPHSGNFDEPKDPMLMTDWFHNSAYQVIHGNTPGYPTILLNGAGDINMFNYSTLSRDRDLIPVKATAPVPPQYRLHFNGTKISSKGPRAGRAQRYLLRLINTSFDTTFIFSIDHHMLEVISADFVPIKTYNTTHLHIGIGQRYNVIVNAEPVPYNEKDNGHLNKYFWIRTTASPCFSANQTLSKLVGYDQTGILSYHPISEEDPAMPILAVTERWPNIPVEPKCRDEAVKDLVPMLPWTVGPPANTLTPSVEFSEDAVADDKDVGERFDVVGNFMFKDPDKYFNKNFPLAIFSIERQGNETSFEPMQIDYDDPIFLHLNDLYKGHQWPTKWAVVDENYTDGSWIYMAIAGRHAKRKDREGYNTGGAHPMHLHGHDFAILQQEENKELARKNINLNKINPPRRDVVLLPADGFVVIAFKVDNPGSWILHCHIAFHASFGLALQVMESQEAALELWPPGQKNVVEAERVCNNWKEFQGNCQKHYPGYNKKYHCWPACNNQTSSVSCPNIFQDDSGI